MLGLGSCWGVAPLNGGNAGKEQIMDDYDMSMGW